MNLPNAITLLRFALAPLIAWRLLARDDEWALALFLVAALSDLIDGALARCWNQRTRFGAVADPLADKLTMLGVVLVLALQGSLSGWFAAAVVVRDLLIVGGALAYGAAVGPVEMAPSRVSKANTALLFMLLLGVMGVRAGVLPAGAWLGAMHWAAWVTLVWSGAEYVFVWSRKARALRGGTG